MYRDIEEGFLISHDDRNISLWNNQIRNGFIRKVYLLLSIQLLVTTLIATPFVILDQAAIVQPWIYYNSWII